ncbi:MAG: hypothetical protein PF542_04690 [Nanoarchaeota archaeon]|jgi:uncharacterized Zn-finger protein|nr:hypothetical protein [Nanoarchaeota archaeon]
MDKEVKVRCPLCGKEFVLPGDLDEHQMNVVCPKCSTDFAAVGE